MAIRPTGATDSLSSGDILHSFPLSITMSAWIKGHGSEPSDGTICGRRNLGINSTSYWLSRGSGLLYGQVGDPAGIDSAEQAWAMGSTNWYHVFFQKNGTGAGALDIRLKTTGLAEGGSAATSNKTPQALLGTGFTIGDTYSRNWTLTHDIAEVAVWDVVLNSNEKNALHEGVAAGLIRPYNLRHYVPLLPRASFQFDANLAPSPNREGAGATVIFGNTLGDVAVHPPVGRATP